MNTALSAQQLDLSRIAPALLIAHEHGRLGAVRGQLRRELNAGRLLKLRRGLYAWQSAWESLTADERYLALVIGVAKCSAHRPVLSHASAAAVHGLPVVGPRQNTVHQLVEPSSGGRSDPGRTRHASLWEAQDVEERDGLLVTTLARTLVDLACTAPVFTAVASIDAALHRPRFGGEAGHTAEELMGAYERMLPFRGSRRALELLSFGDGRAESVNESTSRVTMARLGIPAPKLQHHWLIDGRPYDGDFYWPSLDVAGEADGRSKYLDEGMRSGRTAEEVVYAEKLREDAIRSAVRGFTRWDYETGLSTVRLGARLARLGLHPVQPPWLAASRSARD